MEVLTITGDNFEQEVLQSDKPVLLDFWASWCGPCRMLSPTIDEIAEEHPEIKVCKINIDDEAELAIRHGVMSVPTLMIFKNGEIAQTAVGVRPKDEILDLLK